MKNNQDVSMEENKDTSVADTAGNVSNETESETKEKETKEEKTEKTFTRDEVNKMINAEKNKIKEELEKEIERKQKEAERLAKMDADQKLAYELEQSKKEVENYKVQLNALNVQNEANAYASQKDVPLGYIEDWDFSNMTSDDVKVKIDKLATVRSNDLKGYLNKNLRQPEPKEHGEKKTEDPYIKGFKEYKNK